MREYFLLTLDGTSVFEWAMDDHSKLSSANLLPSLGARVLFRFPLMPLLLCLGGSHLEC